MVNKEAMIIRWKQVIRSLFLVAIVFGIGLQITNRKSNLQAKVLETDLTQVDATITSIEQKDRILEVIEIQKFDDRLIGDKIKVEFIDDSILTKDTAECFASVVEGIE